MNENLNQKSPTTENQKKWTETRTVDITRTFHAPVERLWAAWSRPEFMRQWWGPESFTCPTANIDFREGGKYHMAMKSPEGEVVWGTGEYRQIIPNKLIVCSDLFANEQGQVITPQQAGMSADWPNDYEGFVTIEFSEVESEQTKMTIHHQGIPSKMHDDCVQGWNSSFDKLQRLVERH
ncbi:MAG: SRPBCC domain-containing protein [Pseudobdellovibrionaceae bacterium]